MKKDIHPNYSNDCKVTCSCGNSFTTGSVKDELNTEICSACHPFYSGEHKLVDTAGRLEKYEAKMAKVKAAAELHAKTKEEKAKRKAKAEKQEA